MIKQYIKDGQIVPMEVTIKLLENAMRATLEEDRTGDGWADGKGRFLIDGFPRKMDQALKFDEDVSGFDKCPIDVPFTFFRQVCLSSLVLFYTTTEKVMLERLLKRGETSGRDDDNAESIKKRFRERFSSHSVSAEIIKTLRRCLQGDHYAGYRTLH